MKIFLTIVLGIGVGLGLAYGFFTVRSAAITESFPIDGWPQTGKTSPAECDLFVSSSVSVKLGSIYSGKIHRHQIFIDNVGDAPGAIWVDEVPSSIRLLKLAPGEKQVIPPLTRYLLDVGIVGEFGRGGLDEIIQIKSNQSNSPQLAVAFNSTIHPGVGVLPNRNILYTSHEFADKKPAEVHAVTLLSDQLSIKSIRFSSNPDLFTYKILDFSDEFKDEMKTVRGGKTIRLTPQGDYPETRQRITMFIEIDDAEIAPLEVAIRFGD